MIESQSGENRFILLKSLRSSILFMLTPIYIKLGTMGCLSFSEVYFGMRTAILFVTGEGLYGNIFEVHGKLENSGCSS